MVNSMKLYGYELDKLLSECKSPVTLCRLGVIKLTQKRDEAKRALLKDLVKKVNNLYPEVLPLIKSFLDSLESALKQHYEERMGGAVYKVRARTLSRLIVHSKNDTSALLFEYGTLLHPIFGVPYIPASSLKGALRSYLESIISPDLPPSSIEEIFGSTSNSALIVFTDGYPTKEGEKGRVLEPEVTTPIYRESAREDKASPVPVIYPAVARGVEFTFLVAVKKEAVKYFDKIKGSVTTMLFEGVGAKTTLGYGMLEVSR